MTGDEHVLIICFKHWGGDFSFNKKW